MEKRENSVGMNPTQGGLGKDEIVRRQRYADGFIAEAQVGIALFVARNERAREMKQNLRASTPGVGS